MWLHESRGIVVHRSLDGKYMDRRGGIGLIDANPTPARSHPTVAQHAAPREFFALDSIPKCWKRAIRSSRLGLGRIKSEVRFAGCRPEPFA